jgi:UDP-glucuronate 4-epimerase
VSILITGGAGFIGSHVVEALLARGQRVVALDSFDDFYAREVKERNLEIARSHEGFRLVEGDIRDEATLASLPDVESVVHLAARAGVRPSIEQPLLYSDVNLIGTVRLLEFARVRSIEAFVFASSSSVYGNNPKVPFSEADPVDRPISPYAATKKAGELLCHTATHLNGTTTICLRFFTVYGPRQRPDLAIHKFTRLLHEGRPIPVFGDGSTSRDYTYITDIVDGVEKALAWARANSHAHEVVNLGENRTVSLSEMIRLIGELMGREPQIQRLPMQPGDVERTYADVTKARRLLGYDPRVDFREGLREFIAWFEAQLENEDAGKPRSDG